MKFQLVNSNPRIFAGTSSPSTGWKFSFWVLSETTVSPTWLSSTVTWVFPRRILLLLLTMAPLPIAVALVRFVPDTLAPFPMAVLKPPVVLVDSALCPMAVLETPSVLLRSASPPLAVLRLPLVLPRSAWKPIAAFSTPSELL